MKQLEVAYDIRCEEHYYPTCVFLGRPEYGQLAESVMAVAGMTAAASFFSQRGRVWQTSQAEAMAGAAGQ